MITIGGQLDGLMPPLAACHIVVHYCHVLCYWFGEINFLLLLLLLLLLVLVCCMSSTRMILMEIRELDLHTQMKICLGKTWCDYAKEDLKSFGLSEEDFWFII